MAGISLRDYATYVKNQISEPNEQPGNWIRKHRDGWRNVFAAHLGGSATVHELVALVVSRWEYLGGLYRGNTSENTTQQDAKAFADRFLVQVNPLYAGVHDLTNRRTGGSEIFTMLRNKPLHGANPAGLLTAGGQIVVGWLIGAHDTGHPHLEVSVGSLHIHGDKFSEELLEGMSLYADYLDNNNDALTTPHLPQGRFLRAAWARFRPHYLAEVDWMQLGGQHGIPHP